MRVGELQVASPVRLTLLKIIDGPPTLEKKLHHHFGKHWIRGEWFRADPELLAYIASPTPFPDDEVIPFEEAKETRQAIVCAQCGKKFIPDAKHPWQKYCGVACRIKAHRRAPRITKGRVEKKHERLDGGNIRGGDSASDNGPARGRDGEFREPIGKLPSVVPSSADRPYKAGIRGICPHGKEWKRCAFGTCVEEYKLMRGQAGATGES